MAQPPMPPKAPQMRFAKPWPRHSRVGLPLVLVISSMRFRVIKDLEALVLAYIYIL